MHHMLNPIKTIFHPSKFTLVFIKYDEHLEKFRGAPKKSRENGTLKIFGGARKFERWTFRKTVWKLEIRETMGHWKKSAYRRPRIVVSLGPRSFEVVCVNSCNPGFWCVWKGFRSHSHSNCCWREITTIAKIKESWEFDFEQLSRTLVFSPEKWTTESLIL